MPLQDANPTPSFGGFGLILVAHSQAFNEKIHIRLRSICDVYLSLRVETIGEKLAKLLEVQKKSTVRS